MTENKRNFTEDQRICDAATSGRWRRQTHGPGVVTENGEQSRIIVEDRATLPSDAVFIAEARTGWPAALERIAELEAELAAQVKFGAEALEAIDGNHAEIERLRAALERMDDRKNPMIPRSEMARIAKEALNGTR